MQYKNGRLMRLAWMCSAVFAVVCVSGCGSDTPPAPVTPPPAPITPANASPIVDPNAPVVASESKPPILNVFGELDGAERSPAHAYGDSGYERHTFIEEGFDGDVSLDPTGKWMIFASTRHSEHPNLYLQRVDGMAVTQLTNDEADHAFPVFSPDGKQVAFCSTRSGNWDVYLMDADGKNVMPLTNGVMQCVHPSFSPDGTKIVYSSLGGKSQQWELWVIDLATSEKKMIGFGLFPQWCPQKGSPRIAFQRARQRGSRWFSLWTLDYIDGEARRVTELAVSSNAAIVSPAWSPDGTQLTFATIAEPSNTVGVKPVGQQDIWLVDADGTDRRRLTDGVGMNLSPWWSADNQIYFISDRSGIECVWSLKASAATRAGAVAHSGATHPDVVGTTDAHELAPH